MQGAQPDFWIVLGECHSKCEHLAGVALAPDVDKYLHRVYLAKGVAATTAIEGNTLSEQQVLQHLEGTLQVKGTFRIDGNVKGNIISEQTVILGEGAKVEGQIEGNRVVIAGRFDGVIFAKGRVEIEAKGVVTGEVHSPCMVIDPGGIFDGRCHMLASSDAASGVTIPIHAVGHA